MAAQFLYPEWRCQFYVDESVPDRVIERLLREGAKVRRVGGLPAGRFGTFWRFLVADDEDVDRYLVRDCDACLNPRERTAVDAWLASGRHFHVMRDGPTHTDVMLAGMWAGVRSALPPIQHEIIDYCQTAPLSRTADQIFLRRGSGRPSGKACWLMTANIRFETACPFLLSPSQGSHALGRPYPIRPFGGRVAKLTRLPPDPISLHEVNAVLYVRYSKRGEQC